MEISTLSLTRKTRRFFSFFILIKLIFDMVVKIFLVNLGSFSTKMFATLESYFFTRKTQLKSPQR